MTERDEGGMALDAAPERAAAAGSPPEQATVAGLLSVLDGLERRPLKEQAERLETVRKGLDEALAHPVAAGTHAAGHG
jgi:hypothetical protein